RNVKMQFLMRKDELFRSGLSFGSIRSVAFQAINPTDTGYDYHNLVVSMGCTAEDRLVVTRGFIQGLTEVYHATDQVRIYDGWNELELDQYYNWDTSQHLVIQFCWRESNLSNPVNNPVIQFVPTDYGSAMVLSDASNPNICNVNTSAFLKINYARPYF